MGKHTDESKRNHALAATTHGQSESPAYQSWKGMIQRCRNPKAANFPRYGGKGVTVCKRWLKFANFYADMGQRPSRKILERIDNSKGYRPNNCKWGTIAEQTANRQNVGRPRSTPR